MASDGLQIKLEGAARLDRALSKMAVTKQSAASKIVNQSLNKGAAEVRKKVKAATPKTTGQLKRSVKSGLRKKVSLPTDVFLGGVWFQQGKSFGSADGYYARWVLNRHARNAFGDEGGNNFLTPAVRAAIPSFRKIVGTQLADKIAKENQKEINKLG